MRKEPGMVMLLFVVLTAGAQDLFLTLDDGRRVVLHADKTWDFVTEQTGSAKIRLTSDLLQLTARGMAKRGDLVESSQHALKSAVKKIAESLRPQLSTSVAEAKLLQCIEAEAGDSELLKNFGNDGSVEIRIEFDQGNIQNVINCLNRK